VLTYGLYRYTRGILSKVNLPHISGHIHRCVEFCERLYHETSREGTFSADEIGRSISERGIFHILIRQPEGKTHIRGNDYASHWKKERKGMVCVGVRKHIHPHRPGSPFVSWIAPSTWCNVISRTISRYPPAILSSDTSSPPRVMDFRPRSLYRSGGRIKYLLFACAVKPLAFSASHGVCHSLYERRSRQHTAVTVKRTVHSTCCVLICGPWRWK
jgi:hypothetical protein